jgi:hypothetical protein
MCTLWSDNTCVFTRFHSVKNANTQLIWSSDLIQQSSERQQQTYETYNLIQQQSSERQQQTYNLIQQSSERQQQTYETYNLIQQQPSETTTDL